MAATATEIITASTQLQAASYESIHHFMIKRYGLEYYNAPFCMEIKESLEAIMERQEVQHPAGYTYYEWLDK